MKGLLIAIVMLTSSLSYAATDYSSDVGIRVIAQNVVASKLLAEEESAVLSLALETGRAEFGTMECERALGTDVCSIEVYVKDDESTEEAEETLYNLEVRIYQGQVKSAELTVLAG